MSAGPTNFKNGIVWLITEGHKVLHHSILSYCTWSNGAVERLGKITIGTARSVFLELLMRLNKWPKILPLPHSAPNNTPSTSHGNVSPVTAFSGYGNYSAHFYVTQIGNSEGRNGQRAATLEGLKY